MEHKITGKNVILYFNDARDIADFLHLACARLDCVVEFIEQPEVGVAAIRGGLHPIAVVVDVFMPRIRVEDLLAQIRAIIPEIPILLVTATPNIKESAARLHAADYLQKPFEVDLFTEMVSKFLPSRQPVNAGP